MESFEVEEEMTVPRASSSSASARILLEGALGDLDIRSEVEATMQSMLVDVELGHTLTQQVAHRAQEMKLGRKLKFVSQALQEHKALAAQHAQHNATVADSLVGDLWSFSLTYAEMQQDWRTKHDEKIQQCDALAIQLMQAQDIVDQLRQDQQHTTMNGDTKPDPASVERDEPTMLKTSVEEPNSLEPSVTEPAKPNEPVVTSDSQTPSINEEVSTTEIPTKSEEKDEQAMPVVEEILENEKEANLGDVDETTLMKIIEYLEAFDILSTAQVNVSLYSKIDTLFGLGGNSSVESSDPSPETTVVSLGSTPDPVPVVSIIEDDDDIPFAPDHKAGLSESSGSSSLIPKTNTVPMTAAASSNSSSSTASSADTASTKTTAANRLVGPSGMSTVLSLLQPSRGPKIAESMAKPRGPSPSRISDGKSREKGVMTAAMANSMATKLTAAELSVIISMTEKLKMKEKEVEEIQQEKAELVSNLETAMQQKEFSLEQLRAAEQTIYQTKQAEIKVRQQVASDQEVIAFLDGRVQELETSAQLLEESKTEIQDKLAAVRASHDKKIQVLSDMLQFEREQTAENEAQFKGTKKLLVKEVKSCRAQIISLQADRDGYEEQNIRLREALDALRVPLSSNSPSKER
eukprot:scaffold73049_cov56-Attheya_sp.AAC.2